MRVLRALLVAALFAGVSSASFFQKVWAQSVWQTKRSSWQLLSGQERDQVFAFNEDFKAYLKAAKTEMSSTAEVIRLAKQKQFELYQNPSQVKPGAKLIFNNRDRSVALVVVGSEAVVAGSRVVGTHHDSPRIDVKARPLIERDGYVLFKTIYRGGIKKYQWANLPLMLVGRISTRDGRNIDVKVGGAPGDPVFLIPDAAPHSDKQLRSRTYTEVFEGEELDPIVGSMPDENGSVFASTLQHIFQLYKIDEEDFVSAELSFVPASEPRDAGFDRALTASYGQDDKLSSYVAARALLDLAETPRYTSIAYLTNNEEVGSVNNTGAASISLNVVYGELVGAQRGRDFNENDLRAALRHSQVVSADTNDSLNPLFPQLAEPLNVARLHYGVCIKRYGRGFDANSEFTARIRKLLDDNHIPWQTASYKVDVGGGGTIGGFMSQQDMEVVDMGVPLLSMHATMEMSSKVDVWNFYRFMRAFYESR